MNSFKSRNASHDLTNYSPTVPEGHKHRVTTPEKTSENPADPRRAPQNPRRDPRRALWETLAEPSERQISSKNLAEGCAPGMVTLRNFRIFPDLCISCHSFWPELIPVKKKITWPDKNILNFIRVMQWIRCLGYLFGKQFGPDHYIKNAPSELLMECFRRGVVSKPLFETPCQAGLITHGMDLDVSETIPTTFCPPFREVLHGVGADRVGVKFPIFCSKFQLCALVL